MKQQLTIREIEQKDNAAIAFIIRSVLAEFNANKPGTVYYDPATDDLYSLFQQRNAAYWVAFYDDEIVGGAGVYPTQGLPQGCCELVKLYLTQAVRGKGFGKALMQHCFTTAKALGYNQMYLETMPELNTAVGLYKKFGFKYLKDALGNSGHFGCSVWMLKSLQAA